MTRRAVSRRVLTSRSGAVIRPCGSRRSARRPERDDVTCTARRSGSPARLPTLGVRSLIDVLQWGTSTRAPACRVSSAGRLTRCRDSLRLGQVSTESQASSKASRRTIIWTGLRAAADRCRAVTPPARHAASFPMSCVTRVNRRAVSLATGGKSVRIPHMNGRAGSRRAWYERCSGRLPA
jgi:hypothetical protein